MKDLNNYAISSSIEENIQMMKDIFNKDATLRFREFENQYNGLKCCVFFIDGMVDINMINENVLKPILDTKVILDGIDHIDYMKSHIIISSIVNTSYKISDIVSGIISGGTILFIEGNSKAMIIDTKGCKTRNIEEPPAEKVLRGPREGFTESLLTNLSLIRKRIQTKDLKFRYFTVGERTNTNICICYVEGLAKEEVLDTVIRKINEISTDGVLDIKYIQEFIDDNPFSIFETTTSTEKPDIVTGRLLEGRIAVLVDGSPAAMTAPSVFIEHMMASDDYYLNYFFATIGRIIRIIGFIASISIPALYLSLVSFHQEMIPTPLIMGIYSARQGVPFPTFLELFALLAVFEGLREAGTRVPSPIGESISIVGALVLGTAAVEARFVSAPMIIVVGLTAITGLALPSLSAVIIIIRGFLLILSAMLGFYGYIFGMIGLIIHLFNLRSLGVPFMDNLTSLRPQSLKDTMVRAPMWYMRYRPKFMSEDSKRSVDGGEKDE